MKDDNVIRGRRRAVQRAGPPMRLFLVLFVALATAAILSVTSADTSLARSAVCGNGTLDPGEDCDLSSPSGAFCPAGPGLYRQLRLRVRRHDHDHVPPTTTLPPTTTTRRHAHHQPRRAAWP